MEVVTIDSRNGDGNVHYSYAPGTANRNAYVRTLAGFDAGRLLVTAGGSRNRLRCRRSVRCDDHHRRHGEAIRRLPDRQRIRRAYGCWRVVRLRLGQTSPDQKRGRTAHDRHRRQAGRLPRQQPQRIRRRPATLPERCLHVDGRRQHLGGVQGRQGARRLTLRIQTAGIRRLRGQEPRLHPAHSGHGAATPVFRGRQAGGARLRPGRA